MMLITQVYNARDGPKAINIYGWAGCPQNKEYESGQNLPEVLLRTRMALKIAHMHISHWPSTWNYPLALAQATQDIHWLLRNHN